MPITKFVARAIGSKKIIKPVLNITSKQWKALLNRIAVREVKLNVPGKPGLTAQKTVIPERGLPEAEGVMNAFQPEKEVPYARLIESRMRRDLKGAPSEITDRTVDFPYGQAFLKLKDPRFSIPTGQQAKIPPSASVMTGGLEGLKYERRVFPPFKGRAERVVKAMEHRGPEGRPRITKAEKEMRELEKATGHVEGAGLSQTDEMVMRAATLDGMWTEIGGARSVEGRHWKNLVERARGKPDLTANEYFIRMGLRWIEDPVKTKRYNPIEVKSLEKIWARVMKRVGE